MKYEITTVPNPVLRATCEEVNFDTEKKETKALVDKMVAAMRAHDGIGLSAPQMSITKRVIVAEYQAEDFDEEDPLFPLQVMVNPKILTRSKETNVYLEGCLSLPNLEIEIERPAAITVQFQDLEGKTHVITADKLLARVVQHEVDHLDGVLFTDYEKSAISQNYKPLSHLKGAFISSSDIAVPLLNVLADSSLRPFIVITEKAKPAGRGLKLTKTPIAGAAENLNLPIIETGSKEETAHLLKKFKVDYALVFAFGQILQSEALEAPKYGLFNIHPSLLPQLRGATPIQTALEKGLTESGITLQQMAAEVDAGDIVWQEAFKIEKNEHCDDLWYRIGDFAAQKIPSAFAQALTGRIISHPQKGSGSQAPRITKSDAVLSPNLAPDTFVNRVRALNLWPKAFVIIDGKRIQIERAELVDGKIHLLQVRVEGKNSAKPDQLPAELVAGLKNFHKLLYF